MPNTPRKSKGTEQASEKPAEGRRPGLLRRVRDRLTHPRPGCGYLSAAIGGLAGALAFEPLNLMFLAPLAPFFAFDALRRASGPGAAFRRMLVFGWIFYFGAIHWLTSIGHYAPIPFMASVGIATLALYIAMYLALGVYVLRRWCWPSGPGVQFALFASVWLLAEWLRTLGRLAVPLGELGHTLASWPPAIQPAQFAGELGVSAEILWLSGILYYWYLYFKTMRRKGVSEFQRSADPRLPAIGRGIMPTLMFPVLILASLLLMTMWRVRLENFAKNKEAQSLRVVLVQPNIEQDVKMATASELDGDIPAVLRGAAMAIEETLAAGLPRPDWDGLMHRLSTARSADDSLRRDYAALGEAITAQKARIASEGTSSGADLIVFPETAFNDLNFEQDRPLLDQSARMARLAQAPILAGAGRTDPNDTKIIFNSAYLIEPDGSLAAESYDKMRLVPFGEATPYFDQIPGFQENLVGTGDFTEGNHLTLFDVKGRKADGTFGEKPIKLGVLICFESTFSSSARACVKAGANLLAVITNDGWYGLSAGAAAHRDLSYLRAVETRRYVLRCANTGISTIISPTGEAIATLPLNTAGLLRATIVPKTDYGETMFAKFGNAWLALPAGLLAISFIFNRRKLRIE